jgi:hypothetical protein
MEVIGALASTAQIIHYCARVVSCLHDAYQRAQGSSTQYEEQKNKVMQLIGVVQLIDSMQLSEGKVIADCLDEIKKISHDLCAMMEATLKYRSSKFWKRFIKELYNERGRRSRITRSFESLEQNKTSLALSILATHGQTLVDIKLHIPDSNNRLKNIESTLRDHPNIVEEIRCMRGQLTQYCESMHYNCTPVKVSDLLSAEGKVISQDRSKATTIVHTNNENSQNWNSEINSNALLYEEEEEMCIDIASEASTNMSLTDHQYRIPLRPKQTRHYEQPTSSTLKHATTMPPMQITHVNAQSINATQINGNIGVPNYPVYGSYHYENNFASDGSIQVNGNLYDVDIMKLLIGRS